MCPAHKGRGRQQKLKNHTHTKKTHTKNKTKQKPEEAEEKRKKKDKKKKEEKKERKRLRRAEHKAGSPVCKFMALTEPVPRWLSDSLTGKITERHESNFLTGNYSAGSIGL